MPGVTTTHPDYDKFSKKWKRCRDVSAGQDAVHAATTTYLPKLKDQEEDDYKAYLKRAGFYNATWRTISGLLGMMFRKPPAVELPAAVEGHAEDVTLSGMSLDTFVRTVALEVMQVGRVGVLVDHPPALKTPEVITVAAADEAGLRPSLQIYRTETIINWKYRQIKNRYMLSMVVLKETEKVPVDEFSEKDEDRYRVLDLDEADQYRVRVFKTEEGKDQLVSLNYPLMNGKKLSYIPFGIIGTDGIDSDLDEPPLIDLVDVNLAHYRTNADYEHGCHFTGLPTLFLSGFSSNDDGETPIFYVGSQAAIVAGHPEADGKFIEFTGQGLEALEKNLDRKERQMAVLGARMLADENKQVETLGATQIKRTGENSVLAAIAISVSRSMEWALDIFAQWLGQAGEIVYEINRDYMPAMIDAQQLTALMASWQSGGLSESELFDLFQRADLIDSEKTLEEHQEEIGRAELARPDPLQEAA